MVVGGGGRGTREGIITNECTSPSSNVKALKLYVAWGAKNECLTENTLKLKTLHSWCAKICIVEHILDHTYVHLIFHNQYINKVNLQGLGLLKILF